MATRRAHRQDFRRWTSRRRYLVRGRLRVPFAGYQRQPTTAAPGDAGDDGCYPVAVFGARHGLTLEQAHQAQELLEHAVRQRGRLTGPRCAARIAGIVSAVKHGRVGSSSWGWSMHGKRGGQVMARHALHHLRAISPAGVRASVIARERRKAREAYEQDRPRRVPHRLPGFLAL